MKSLSSLIIKSHSLNPIFQKGRLVLYSTVHPVFPCLSSAHSFLFHLSLLVLFSSLPASSPFSLKHKSFLPFGFEDVVKYLCERLTCSRWSTSPTPVTATSFIPGGGGLPPTEGGFKCQQLSQSMSSSNLKHYYFPNCLSSVCIPILNLGHLNLGTFQINRTHWNTGNFMRYTFS